MSLNFSAASLGHTMLYSHSVIYKGFRCVRTHGEWEQQAHLDLNFSFLHNCLGKLSPSALHSQVSCTLIVHYKRRNKSQYLLCVELSDKRWVYFCSIHILPQFPLQGMH